MTSVDSTEKKENEIEKGITVINPLTGFATFSTTLDLYLKVYDHRWQHSTHDATLIINNTYNTSIYK